MPIEKPVRGCQVRIRYRAFKLMIMGTVLVTGASDPMVDCLAEWGNRLGVSPSRGGL